MSRVTRWAIQSVGHLLEETARGALPPEEPGVLRLLSGVAWRLDRALAPVRAAHMAEEVRRTFGVSGATLASVVREAHDVGLQARLEELLVPRLDDAQLARFVQVTPNIRALGGPALVVYPHAGNLLVLLAALARRTEGLVVFAEREGGGAPSARRRGRREAEEARLGITWETDPEALAGHFAAGRVVAAAFDDRGWRRYAPVTFLGRPALLSPEPWEVCVRMGVPVVPASIHRGRDKVNRLAIGAPRPADLERYLRTEAEPFLTAHPGQYAAWLAACRDHAGAARPPLFTDDADLDH